METNIEVYFQAKSLFIDNVWLGPEKYEDYIKGHIVIDYPDIDKVLADPYTYRYTNEMKELGRKQLEEKGIKDVEILGWAIVSHEIKKK